MPYLTSISEALNAIYAGSGIISANDNFHNVQLKENTQSAPYIVIKNEASLTKAARLAPPSKWNALCHGREEQIVRNAEGHVLNNWNWPSEKIKNKVIGAKFGRAAALCFPLAQDDRIELICRLCMILVLVDDILDHLSHAEGKAYNEHLITIMSGSQAPNSTIPAEQLLHELWIEARAQDSSLAEEMLNGTISWFGGMTESDRNSHSTLGAYLDYRERDVGMAMLSAMVRYAMNIHLTPSELEQILPVEKNFVRQYCAVNDVCSWEKEAQVAARENVEGAKICSGVQVLMDETSLPKAAAKKLLWTMARGYSDEHDDLAAEMVSQGCSEEVQRYLEGMKCLMAGNEEWCLTSARYNDDIKV